MEISPARLLDKRGEIQIQEVPIHLLGKPVKAEVDSLVLPEEATSPPHSRRRHRMASQVLPRDSRLVDSRIHFKQTNRVDSSIKTATRVKQTKKSHPDSHKTHKSPKIHPIQLQRSEVVPFSLLLRKPIKLLHSRHLYKRRPKNTKSSPRTKLQRFGRKHSNLEKFHFMFLLKIWFSKINFVAVRKNIE